MVQPVCKEGQEGLINSLQNVVLLEVAWIYYMRYIPIYKLLEYLALNIGYFTV